MISSVRSLSKANHQPLMGAGHHPLQGKASKKENQYSIVKEQGRVRNGKLAQWEGRVVNLSPGYEDCKRLAVKKKITLKEVFEEARKEALTFLEKSKSRLR